MNWLDYTLIIMAAVFVIEGVWKGFSRQIIGLAAVVVGLLAGLWFYGTAASFLLPYVSKPAIAKLLGFIFVFAGVQVLGGIAGWAAAKAMKATGLGWLDRSLGACFGLLKAALVAIIVVLALSAFAIKPLPDMLAGSRIAPYAIGASNLITYLAPRDLRDGFVGTYERLREFWIQQHPGTGNKLPSAQA